MSESPAAEFSSVSPAVEGCLEGLRRCRRILEEIERDARDRRTSLFPVFGPHLRHGLDHYECLLGGVESGEVDYDARRRDERAERDSGRLRSALEALHGRLTELSDDDVGRPLRVRQSVAPGGRRTVSFSSLERELVFVSGHMIHHLAIMQLLAREQGLPLPDDLGLAFSTAAHRRTRRAAPPG